MSRAKINVLVVVGLIALFFPVIHSVSADNSENKISNTAITQEVIVGLINKNRIEQGLPTLQINPTLTRSTELKGRDMIENGYFAHVSPGGKSPWYWFKEAGYQYAFAGENLAVNFVDPESLVNAWMKSPSHRENILNKNYTETGISIVYGDYKGKKSLFIIQHFGTVQSPKTTAININQFVKSLISKIY